VTAPESADLQEWQDSSAVTTTHDTLSLATEPLVVFPSVGELLATDESVPGPDGIRRATPPLRAGDVVEADAYSTIESLMAAGWTPEQIMAANKDALPATAKDCQEVAEILLEAAARQAKGEGQDATGGR